MTNEAVIEKVRKLRALATSQNAHEAAAAAAAADKLIQEHRLSEAELHAHAPGQVVLRIYGTPSDIEIVRYMYAWLTTEAERLVNHASVKGRTGRNSWFIGFVTGVREQLHAAKQATDVAATKAGRGAGLV